MISYKLVFSGYCHLLLDVNQDTFSIIILFFQGKTEQDT